MNFSNIKQLKSISNNLTKIKKDIKKYIKRQDILDFIEKEFKQKYTNFEINEYYCKLSQGNKGDTFSINTNPNLTNIIISKKNHYELEEYEIGFDKEKTIIKHRFYSAWKLTGKERIYEYYNDILVRETKRITEGYIGGECFSEEEAIYDMGMKMLMTCQKEFFGSEENKTTNIKYNSTSFVEAINIDTNKNDNSNYSYLDLHIPFVEVRKANYDEATTRLIQKKYVKAKEKTSKNGDKK